jgi:hypothetical protein
VKKIFSDYGIDIHENNGQYFLTFDQGEIAVQMTTIEISKEDAEKAQQSANDAYQVIIKHQNNARNSNV